MIFLSADNGQSHESRTPQLVPCEFSRLYSMKHKSPPKHLHVVSFADITYVVSIASKIVVFVLKLYVDTIQVSAV
jgi:hypothetical protein